MNAPIAATPGGGGGLSLGRTILLVLAAVLLGASLVPGRYAAQAGLGRSQVATIKTGLAVAGLSVVLGYLITVLLGKTA